MEKENHSQLELFSQIKDESGIALPRKRAFFHYMRGNEKAILVIIGFILTAIVSFCLGVEKGRSALKLKGGFIGDMAQKSQPPTAAQKPAVRTLPLIRPQDEVTLAKPAAFGQAYTIQVASYQKMMSARQEAEVLKKKGFSTMILTKGKYTVLCVGNFPNRQAAEEILTHFRKQKRYQGCSIRRL